MIVGVINSSLTMLAHRNILLVRVTVTICPTFDCIDLSLCIHFSDVSIIVVDISDPDISLLFLESRIACIPVHD